MKSNEPLISYFPVNDINKYSEVEKGPGRPPYWEMVFWWTRKPLASARAVIASALLPREAYSDIRQFLDDLFYEQKIDHIIRCRSVQKTVHNCDPSPRLVDKLKGKKLLDPFAGFGSIPLEGLRLGLDVTAVELLPTAYVFLKAILDYPSKFKGDFAEVSGKEIKELKIEEIAKRYNNGKQVIDSGIYKIPRLIYDVAKWGSWVTKQLMNDPDIKELYDDAAVYIGTWEIKCPVCGKYTPLIGNWWLARVKKSNNEYERLAWMEWDNGIKITDLNKKCREESDGSCNRLAAKVITKNKENMQSNDTKNGEFDIVEWHNNKYKVPLKNINSKKEMASCLYCKAEINHRVVNGQLRILSKKEGDWYVKWALKQWNTNLEKYLTGGIGLNELLNSPARPRLLVKVKEVDGNLEFEPATVQDNDKLWKALEKLKAMWGDPDIPIEQIPPYSNRYLFPILYGFDKWFKLFNPRQLLTLVKLIKLIRDVGLRVEEYKLKEGLSKEEAYKYAEAITTYIATTLCKHADWNSAESGWQLSYLIVAHTLAMRGIAMIWNWGEYNPLSGYRGTFKAMMENIVENLAYLVNAISNNSNIIRVLLDDATTLSKLDNEKFDVIVTDPPYADDVPYTELSDFYYVWLKRALSDNDGISLKPRFLTEAFFDEFGVEIPAQWQVFATREVSEDEGRFKYFNAKVSYIDLLARAFSNLLRFLKDDGLFVIYYVAKKPESWEALINALWHVNDLELVTAFPVATESEESVVARGKASVLGGYISVWRKRSSSEPLDLDAAKDAALAEVVKRINSRLKVANRFEGHTLWVYSYMAALEYLTSYKPVKTGGIELDVKGLMNYAVALAFEAILKKTGVELHDNVAQAYLALRIVENERGYADSDVLSHVERAVGFNSAEMVKHGLLGEVETEGPKVAKRKTFEVLAPRKETIDEIDRVFHYQRGKSPILDCFRQLQLNAMAKVPVNCSEDIKREAMNFAKALIELSRVGIIDKDDVDVKIARIIIGAEWWQL